MKSNELPLVSIVIPCFNAELWVADAIRSALAQTYRNVEVLVVDDGSTDGSLEAIKDFEQRVRVFSGTNQGACAARNKGLCNAAGKYVKFLDSDDVLLSDIVQSQVDESESREELSPVLVYSSSISTDEKGTPIMAMEEYRNLDGDEDPIVYFLQHNIHTSGPLHHRQMLIDAGGFDEELPRAQEYDLHLRLAASGVEFYFLPGVSTYVRQHSDPNRISNQDFLKGDPLSDYHRFKKRFHTLSMLSSKPLSEQVLKLIARSFWMSGRRVLRMNHKGLAAKYFHEARQLSPSSCVAGSRFYRLLVSTLGPFKAEALVAALKRAV